MGKHCLQEEACALYLWASIIICREKHVHYTYGQRLFAGRSMCTILMGKDCLQGEACALYLWVKIVCREKHVHYTYGQTLFAGRSMCFILMGKHNYLQGEPCALYLWAKIVCRENHVHCTYGPETCDLCYSMVFNLILGYDFEDRFWCYHSANSCNVGVIYHQEFLVFYF